MTWSVVSKRESWLRVNAVLIVKNETTGLFKPMASIGSKGGGRGVPMPGRVPLVTGRNVRSELVVPWKQPFPAPRLPLMQ